MCNIIDKMYLHLKNAKWYTKFYEFSFLSLVFYGIVKYFFNIQINQFIYFITIFLIIATTVHSMEILNILWKKPYIKWFYGISMLFITIYTDSLSRLKIYNITLENPDNYPVAINILDMIYAPIYFILFWISIFLIINFVIPFLFIIINVLIHFFEKWFPGFSKEIQKNSYKVLLNTLPLIFSIVIIYLIFSKYQNEINNFSNKNLPKLILLSSYYPNKKCNNEEIKDNYIKLLGVNDKVSVSNIDKNEISTIIPMDFIYSMIRLDKEVKFTSTICNK